MALDHMSLSTVPVTAYFNQLRLPEATAFIWKRRDRYYLITNWHVVSGMDFFTKQLILTGGSRPNKLKCHFVVVVEQYRRDLIDIDVRDEEDQPLWLVHPVQDTRPVDVVAVPLDDDLQQRVSLLPVNELAPGKLAIKIGMDVFILGYPFGSSPPAFPVWKRGSIASEPDLVTLTTGYYLVDTSSRPGMSGSPVILRSWANHVLESNAWVSTNDQRPVDRIIGVYSGRKRPEDAQIGLVWHVDYIDQIIDGQRRDC